MAQDLGKGWGRTILLLIPLLFILAACAGGGGDDFDFDTCGLRPRVQIPVQMTNGVPLMRADVRGQGAILILDTGSVGVVLTEPALERLGLQTDTRRIMGGRGVGGESRFYAGKLTDFSVGGLAVPDHPVRVLPRTDPIAARTGIDGLFGVSVLSVFDIDLDLPHRRVTLYAGRICADTKVPPWDFPYYTIEATSSVGGRFIIPVELNGRRVSALIDTGASRTVLSAATAAAVGVTPAMLEHDPPTTLIGVGPASPTAYLHRFRELRVGGATFTDMPLLVTPRTDSSAEMILGSDYLATHHLWLSAVGKRVFIDRTAPR